MCSTGGFADDSFARAGGLIGVGIASAAVRSEFDAALAIIPEQMGGDSAEIQVGATVGLAMAYAGSCRAELLEIIKPLTNSGDKRVACFAAMAIGLVFVGSCDPEASEVVSGLMSELEPDVPAAVLGMVGLGLIFLGQQARAEAAVEIIKTLLIESGRSDWADFAAATVSSMAYAGTGAVLQVQNNLRLIASSKTKAAAAAVLGTAIVALGDKVSSEMARRSFEHVLQFGCPEARRMAPIGVALTSLSNPAPEIVDMLHRVGHDTDIGVAGNAGLGLGLVGAGTENSRVLNALRGLATFQGKNPATVALLQIAEGLAHLGQGLMGIAPFYGDGLLNPVALGSLLCLAFAAIEPDLLTKTDPSLIFMVAPAATPRFLCTLNEDLALTRKSVRVGQAVDVVGQAGKPRGITGFQTLDSPVQLAAGQRAELVDENLEALSPVLEGFVIVRERPKKE